LAISVISSAGTTLSLLGILATGLTDLGFVDFLPVVFNFLAAGSSACFFCGVVLVGPVLDRVLEEGDATTVLGFFWV
jgi:hypothetical protein